MNKTVFGTIAGSLVLGAVKHKFGSSSRESGEVMYIEDMLEMVKVLNGFGGYCPYAAVAINSYFFNEELPYYLTVNRYLYEEKDNPRGHVALHFNLHGENFYLDSDGIEKPIDMIDSWGMVELEDYDGIDKEDKEYETLSFTFTDSNQMLAFWGIVPSEAEPIIVAMTKALHGVS
jgi:hypothetical protein